MRPNFNTYHTKKREVSNKNKEDTKCESNGTVLNFVSVKMCTKLACDWRFFILSRLTFFAVTIVLLLFCKIRATAYS